VAKRNVVGKYKLNPNKQINEVIFMKNGSLPPYLKSQKQSNKPPEASLAHELVYICTNES
jgi:hypothetical protein